MPRVLRSQSRSTPSFPAPSAAEKLTRIVARHDQLKISFDRLKSQIKLGLLEAEDVFVSLAAPLMKLVGLKTDEMANEGRFTTISVVNPIHSEAGRRNEIESEAWIRPPSDARKANQNHNVRTLKEESYITNATMAGEELVQKQKFQLAQLVHLLKQIDNQLDCSQNDILQILANSWSSIQKIFQKAAKYAHSNQDNNTFMDTLQLLKATLLYIGSALSSVESGVGDVMCELSAQIGNPMVEYAKGLKAEMNNGTCPRLMAIVEEMGGAMRNGRLELEEARNKARITENMNVEALRRLKESEETVRRMKENVGFLLGSKRESNGRSAQHKLLGNGEDQREDEKLLWEMLKNKRKRQVPESPLGPSDLLGIKTNNNNNKQLKSTGIKQELLCRRITRSYARGLNPQTPPFNSRLPLGSSPSATTKQQVSSRKCATTSFYGL